MTATEDRLTDALHAAARSVTAPTLRPLADHPAPRHVSADPRRPRRRWLAAAASASAVALIAGLAVAVSGRLHASPARPASGALPRFYAEVGQGGPLVVRATATGRVTAHVPDPQPPGGEFWAVTTAGDLNFFAEYVTPPGAATIYRFQVTAAGQVTGLAPVPGGRLSGAVALTMAASPRGSQLALAVEPVSGGRAHRPERIVVLSTQTGARTTWAGGEAPHGQNPHTVTILQLSWTADGRELAYLGRWACQQPPASTHGVCGNAGPLGGYEEVRTLDPAAPGGRLDSGRLLQRAPVGYLSAAAIGPDGRTLTDVEEVTQIPGQGSPDWHLFRIIKVDARTGRAGRVLGQLRTRGRGFVDDFVPGPSGRNLIVLNGTSPGAGAFNGWISRGRPHRLGPAASGVTWETW